jgi:ceramide synthetase
MFSLAFYWSLTISQFFDVKRKDFWQMFIHHIATICLMAFSWVCNLHRMGTLVLLIHDCADVFLEVSCMCLTFVCEFVNACFRCLHRCITPLVCCSINCPPLLKNMVHVTYFSEFAEFIFKCMNLHLEATKRHVLLIADYENFARITKHGQD